MVRWTWPIAVLLLGGCAPFFGERGRVPEPDMPEPALATASAAPDFTQTPASARPRTPPVPQRRPRPPATPTAQANPSLAALTAAPTTVAPASGGPVEMALLPPSLDVASPSSPPPAPSLPRVTPEMLVGLSETETERLLGQPARVRREPPSTVWNYAAGPCSLDVYFYFDLSTSRFRSLAYEMKTGGRSEDAEQHCLGSIQALQRPR